MNKCLARYFVKLISEDLQFSFNGMGIPSYRYEWLETQIMKENFDEVEEFIKKRYDERENTRKKTRKFKAMTIGEHCDYMRSRRTRCRDCEYFRNLSYCDYSKFNEVKDGKEPYKTKDGKYIFVEVKSC